MAAKTDFELLEVRQDDFREFFHAYRTGFTGSTLKLWRLFAGDYRPEPSQREAALAEYTQRMLALYRSDPSSHWLKVIEKGTGKIVGGGRWVMFTASKPYEGQGGMEASWFPEGQPREFATICLNQSIASSAKNMNRQHAYLNLLFTLPQYRRKGVSSLIMNWGLVRADNLGLECYVEASQEGKLCYEKFGFKAIDENSWHVEKKDDANEEWKFLESQLLTFRWWSMVRGIKSGPPYSERNFKIFYGGNSHIAT